MSGKTLQGFLVNLKDGSAGKIEFVDTLDNLYQILDVEMIDVTERKIGDYWYDIVCDDEGLLKDRRIPTAFNSKQEPQLVGSLLLVNHDDEGEFTSLTEEQLEDLKKHLAQYLFNDGSWVQMITCLMDVEYE